MSEVKFKCKPYGDWGEILGIDGEFAETELVISETLSYTDEKGTTIEGRVVRIGRASERVDLLLQYGRRAQKFDENPSERLRAFRRFAIFSILWYDNERMPERTARRGSRSTLGV